MGMSDLPDMYTQAPGPGHGCTYQGKSQVHISAGCIRKIQMIYGMWKISQYGSI